MKNLTPKQLDKWLRSLPETTDIHDNFGWSEQQIRAVYEKYGTARNTYKKLLQDLININPSLAGLAEDNAIENIEGQLVEFQFGYWSMMISSLTNCAGSIWESENRNVNDELGYVVY